MLRKGDELGVIFESGHDLAERELGSGGTPPVAVNSSNRSNLTVDASERFGGLLKPSWPVTAMRRGRGGVSVTRLSFLFMVVVPTLIAAVFSFFIASNRYTSEFRVAVRSMQQKNLGGIGEVLGFSALSGGGNDANAVVQYLESRQAIEDLGGAQLVSKLYDSESIDWFSRLDARSKIEKLTRYWNRMVDPVYELSTGTIIVDVTAFSAEESRDLAVRLLANSESLVNKMSDRAHHDSVDFAEKEVGEAQTRLDSVREKIRSLQDREAILDPLKTAETTLSIAAKLKDQIAKTNAELITQKARLSDDAPSVVGTRNTISGLQRELARIESEATAATTLTQATDGAGTDHPLTSILGAFQQLADDKTFAEKAYLNALASLETAKMDAAKQQVYLATIVPPGLPEEPSFPKPIRMIFLTLGVALSLWVVSLLSVHAVREHA